MRMTIKGQESYVMDPHYHLLNPYKIDGLYVTPPLTLFPSITPWLKASFLILMSSIQIRQTP